MHPNLGKMSGYKYMTNPLVHAGVGDLAEGEPFQLLFRFCGGANYGGPKFGMTELLVYLLFV